MTAVERVKTICKERKIPISKLEKDLGFSNAYISQIRSGTIRGDRLDAIARYLNVSTDYLLYGEEKQRHISDEEIKFALFHGADVEITDEMYEEVKRFAQFVAEREKEKKKE